MIDQKQVTDYHCHILPGIDDGPETLESSVSMARIFYEAGYREIYCTSHLIKGQFEVSSADILDARSKLQADLDREKIGIKLLVGREHYLDEFLLDYLKDPLLLEGTNFLMVEIPGQISIELVKEIVFKVTCRGYIPLIAHPERCNLLELQRPEKNNTRFWNSWINQQSSIKNHQSNISPNLLTYLQNIGCRFQANLGSFQGLYGKQIQQKAQAFQKASIYTHTGSDAHNPDHLKQILNIP